MSNINSSNFKKIFIEKVTKCERCTFHLNGKVLPWFGERSKYLMIGEAPHIEEVDQNSPFVGTSGKKMWDIMESSININREDFIIMNSVLCKPNIFNKKNIGKPSKNELDLCFLKRTNLLKYFYEYFNIKNILVLGNYAKYIFTNDIKGIDSLAGVSENINFLNCNFIITYCIHPSSVIYNPNNKEKFMKGLYNFKNAIGI